MNKAVRISVVVVSLLGACTALALFLQGIFIAAPWYAVVLLGVACGLLVYASVKSFGSHLNRAFVDQYRAQGVETRIGDEEIEYAQLMGLWLCIGGLACFLLGWVLGGPLLTEALFGMLAA